MKSWLKIALLLGAALLIGWLVAPLIARADEASRSDRMVNCEAVSPAHITRTTAGYRVRTSRGDEVLVRFSEVTREMEPGPYLYCHSLAFPVHHLFIPAERATLGREAELTGEPQGGSPSIVPIHDAYDWINKGGYRSGAGELCCGKDDCYEIAAARVHENPTGYWLPDHNITVPAKQAIPSEDGKYWICKVGARMRCFFAPLTGF